MFSGYAEVVVGGWDFVLKKVSRSGSFMCIYATFFQDRVNLFDIGFGNMGLMCMP